MQRAANFLGKIERLNQPSKIILGLVLIGAIGILDYLTGYELAFSVFYVIPISIATWLAGRGHGIMASSVSAIVWLGADEASGHFYSNPFVPVWNTLIRLSFFIIIALLLSALKSAMEREKELARTDFLTGAVNSRLFLELLQMEIDRLQRYKRPFTLIYLDLDNFKTINDRLGHLVGDQVLHAIVSYTKEHLRKTDVIARLGGDEFAILLPETSQESARASLTKLQGGLLQEMQKNGWQLTFSAGVLTCNSAPNLTNELVKMADELTYMVKRNGKNAVEYSIYSG
jgi:diguanylate cyclase (GGDEF)-like protein